MPKEGLDQVGNVLPGRSQSFHLLHIIHALSVEKAPHRKTPPGPVLI